MLASLLPTFTLLGLSGDGWAVLAAVAAATVLMVMEKGGPDLVLFAALCGLVVLGVISPRAAMVGFADPATITIGVLFVVAQGMQETGALSLLQTSLFRGAKGPRGALLRLVTPVAGLSAFVNNTPIVAMFVPVASGFARRVEVPPSRFLMPLSFAAMLGGTCTLVGTSTNLVVSGLMEQQGLEPLGMFELTAVGLPTAALGILYLAVFAPRILTARADPYQAASEQAREYLAEVEVAEDSPLVGRSIEDAGLRNLPGLFLVEIRRRGGTTLRPVAPEDRLARHDHLVFTGVAAMIRDLAAQPGLVPTGETPSPGHGIYEVVVSHTSSLVGRTVRSSNFRRRFDAAILAVHRAGERIEGRIGDIVLRPGDTLLLTASPGFLETFQQAGDFYLVSEVPSDGQPRYRRAWIAFVALGVVVVLPTAGAFSLLQAAMLATLLLLASRSLSPRAARKAVAWNVLVLIGAGFGISRALIETDAAAWLAQGLIDEELPGGGLGMLAVTYLLSMTLSLFVSNAAAAAIVFPVVITAATTAGLDPRPYAVCVAMAASAAFATPIGYQTNLMVQGPGGYRYLDFVRFGAPLTVICFTVVMILVPWLWPLV